MLVTAVQSYLLISHMGGENEQSNGAIVLISKKVCILLAQCQDIY